MKVDGGVASTTVLQKVKVKEEAKECCSFQQVSATSSGGSSVVVVVSTVTAASTTTATVIATTSSNCNSNGLTTVGIAAATLTSTPTTTTTVPTTSSTSNSLQTSAIICHPSTPATIVATSTAQTPEPLPVDLDLKSKNKASPTSSRDKTSRDENNHSEVLSPSSQHHQRQSTQSNGSRSEYKGQLGCSRSSDNDSPMSSQPLKPDVEESTGGTSTGTSAGPISAPATVTASTTSGPSATCRNEEQIEASPLLSNGVRCITGFFAGHGKLKRLLGTLVQFATDISADTGDTVRTLVLALLSGTMTAEEFHSALQEATNFPLRGFVLPYLKHTLPSLQRDLNTAARASNQTCAQFLRNNETAILEAVGLVQSGESVEIFGEHGGNGLGSGNTSGNQCPPYYSMRSNSNPNVGAIQHSNNATNALHHYSGSSSHAPKRRASDTPYYENGTLLEDIPVYGKRHNPWGAHHQQQQQQQHQQQQQQPQQTENSSSYCWYHPLHAAGGSIQGHGHGHGHGPSPIPPSLVQINQINAFSTPHHLSQQQQQLNHVQNGSSFDDEWKNIHVMLNCILGMVEKTKRALAILQRRGCSSPASTPVQPANVIAQNGNANNTAGNNPSTNGAQVESSTGDRDGSLKRLSGEIVAQTIRATEDRVAEVKRRAEEAVLEVKRAAVAEVQRAVAVAVAESRASERLRVHRLLDLPLSQRSHVGVRQASFVRVHGSSNVVETSGRTAPTPTTTSNSAPSATEDDKDTHLTNIVGSSCWNCGRPALETCGGCGIARYCGSFCQHRDWEAGGHHATCNNPLPREPRRSSSRSPPRIGTANVTGSINDAEGSTVSATTANTISKGK
ncbi:PREDICTED: protein CBFA2T2 [Polistes canadensis]|uniref:protein CBFA2T2 n=1 Tax=Polistes canadensis TaxID=91411 RepID=UPI0007190209|nr:PREDICTED: protein CBFA2T2 [Polistes canadensis]XP_014603872.1 PREDICTED: protein CBFA2T2 [Polistes canadensis]XP_014603873.1 PREDICTED: protein CBFA2T2 [Polistes canadensis]XP_014603874.1 PREDICTED: protein CBFA2T2 [Polistes canadensis]XP_014603875.1 PREDICTED: protein CBFA2T2 [Polistes canadensis]